MSQLVLDIPDDTLLSLKLSGDTAAKWDPSRCFGQALWVWTAVIRRGGTIRRCAAGTLPEQVDRVTV